jgi:hypothetical protein
VLYTSLRPDTARREIGRYFTVPPKDGFVLATIELGLNVVDLSTKPVKALVDRDHSFCQSVGQLAWESGIEALLVPSAVIPEDLNLAVLVDNQEPGWKITLRNIS